MLGSPLRSIPEVVDYAPSMTIFDKLYKTKCARDRHNQAPFAAERARFLSDLLRKGRKPVNVLQAATHVLQINRTLGFTKRMHPVTPDELRQAGARWVSDSGPFRKRPAGTYSYELFARLARGWLRHQACLVEPKKTRLSEERLRLFESKLRNNLGLAPATIETRTRHVSYFLIWLAQHRVKLCYVSLPHVERYLEHKRRDGWALKTQMLGASSLRMFLRHAEEEHIIRPGLYQAVPKFALPKFCFVAKGPTWTDVRRILASTYGDGPSEIRTRAMVLLMALYGLRCSEVRQLRLDDVDFDNRVLLVRRGKTRLAQRFPLNRETSIAIKRYLNCARPRSDCPALFITHVPFYRQLSRGTIYCCTNQLFKNNSIESVRKGPHALRHACADRLLRQGSSVGEIAAFLGHKRTRSLRDYVRYSVDDLRPIAEFTLRGVQ
jgi:integrase/recombinase XerD